MISARLMRYHPRWCTGRQYPLFVTEPAPAALLAMESNEELLSSLPRKRRTYEQLSLVLEPAVLTGSSLGLH